MPLTAESRPIAAATRPFPGTDRAARHVLPKRDDSRLGSSRADQPAVGGRR
jgi:hypothetical protein